MRCSCVQVSCIFYEFETEVYDMQSSDIAPRHVLGAYIQACHKCHRLYLKKCWKDVGQYLQSSICKAGWRDWYIAGSKKSHQVILITSLQTCKPQCKRESERTAEHEENILDIKRKELEQITMSLVVAHG